MKLNRMSWFRMIYTERVVLKLEEQFGGDDLRSGH